MVTSTVNPDLLPEVGYTRQQLSAFIRRQLGEPTWIVELTEAQCLDQVQIALSEYNKWRPRIRFGSVALSRNVWRYMVGQDIGIPFQVDFVDTLPAPTEIFYGNLISPAPMLKTGLDEYDSFMRWRKTWQRVMSVTCEWEYDEYNKVLMVHNPIERYHCGIRCMQRYPDTTELDFIGCQWVRDYALAKSRYVYGEILAKFGNAIPAPLKDLQLDNQKRTEANKQLEELLNHLKGMQISTAMIID